MFIIIYNCIRPLMEYACKVSDVCYNYLFYVDELEKLQLEAARIISNIAKSRQMAPWSVLTQYQKYDFRTKDLFSFQILWSNILL